MVYYVISHNLAKKGYCWLAISGMHIYVSVKNPNHLYQGAEIPGARSWFPVIGPEFGPVDWAVVTRRNMNDRSIRCSFTVFHIYLPVILMLWGRCTCCTRWCPPPSYKLVYKPMNTIDISPTKTIVVGVINQLSYLGAPPCIFYWWFSSERLWVLQPFCGKCHLQNLRSLRRDGTARKIKIRRDDSKDDEPRFQWLMVVYGGL